MEIITYPDKELIKAALKRPLLNSKELEEKVSFIIEEVKQKGDEAIKKFTSQFDRVGLTSIAVSEAEIKEAEKNISKKLKEAIHTAKKNIEIFHKAQLEEPKLIETVKGVTCWRKSVPIEKVGLYIPGGSAPLFSSVLMLGIPAVIAGCKEISLCTPANQEEKIHPAILYCANIIGIRRIYKVGGAQAIAAMAYGTESVPAVYKIFGPGNQYVTMAKQLVNKDGIAIDMPAGPSEVAVLADESCYPEFVAADLLSQAEHGPDSQVILVSNSEKTIQQILKELETQIKNLERNSIASKALKNSKAILVHSLEEGMNVLNQYAPEHLIIASDKYGQLQNLVVNAGSVFLGNYACESAGDYASGTNHTLPTNGFAKAYSGVSLDSFVKKITFQELNKKGIQTLGPAIEIMAEAEGLLAHKNSVSIRLNKLKNDI